MLKFLLWSILLINLMAFLAVGIDKLWAKKDRRRIPEGHLLLLALLAGFPGVWLGMTLFRHKTQKKSFQWKLIGMTVLNAAWAILYWKMSAP